MHYNNQEETDNEERFDSILQTIQLFFKISPESIKTYIKDDGSNHGVDKYGGPLNLMYIPFKGALKNTQLLLTTMSQISLITNTYFRTNYTGTKPYKSYTGTKPYESYANIFISVALIYYSTNLQLFNEDVVKLIKVVSEKLNTYMADEKYNFEDFKTDVQIIIIPVAEMVDAIESLNFNNLYTYNSTNKRISNEHHHRLKDILTKITNDENPANYVYDDRKYTWTLETQVTSSASGDPYISTLGGFKYKLPNKYQLYRCIETTINNKDLIVNTIVSQLGESEIGRLISAFPGMYNTSKDGFFFDQFFIKYGASYAIFNRDIELVESNLEDSNKDSFSINYITNSRVFSCPLQGETMYTGVTINIHGVDIQLMKMEHPQIINGIYMTCNKSMVHKVTGLLNTDHPAKCVIKHIKSVKPVVKYNKKQKTTIPFEDIWVPYIHPKAI